MDPESWLNFLPPVPKLRPPASLAEWIARREQIRSELWQLLGDLPPRRLNLLDLQTEDRGDYVCEKFALDNGVGSKIPGYLLLPKHASTSARVPGILYCHWHGEEYDVGKEELFRADHTPEPPGPALARQGYAVLCIDAFCFGERSGCGPGGRCERGRDEEHSSAKFNFWAGRSLWGMILRDDLIALDYLASRPAIDIARIGAMGVSMGATRTWWLMALDERLRAGMAAACLTRYQDLISSRGLDKHGVYYYVPNILQHFDTESIIALIAPRPILFQTGDQDAGSPLTGIKTIEKLARPFWQLTDNTEYFQNLIDPGVGHEFTRTMWSNTLKWFATHLGTHH